jgi:hypothetical protein
LPIFLGDSGSLFLGLILGAVSLKTFMGGTFVLSLAIPFLVLGEPLFDTLLAVWRRSIRLWPPGASGNGQNGGIMQADAEHLHHRLLKMGLNTRTVSSVLWLANALVVFESYQVVWSRVQAKDVFKLALALWLGLAVSVAMALLLDPSRTIQIGWWGLLVGSVSHLAIVSSRLFYRGVEEIVPWLLRRKREKAMGKRVLL